MSYGERLARHVYWGIVVFGLLTVIIWLFEVGKDPTDPPHGRSGLGLYTDSGTGCQYLKAGLFGGITPRLRKDGTPFCGAIE